jgi:spore germination protein KC
MRRLSRLLGLLVVLLLLSGCWDRREINDVAFVMGTAVDKQGDEYLLSVQFPLPGQMGGPGTSGGGGGTSGDKSWYTDSETGKSLREIDEKLQRALSRRLYFAHRRVILLGENMAKDDITPAVELIARVPMNRMTTIPLIVKGEARSLFSTNIAVERYPTEMMRELAVGSLHKTISIMDVMRTLLEEGKDPAIPYLEQRSTKPGAKGESKSTIMLGGMAVFQGSRLAGLLNDEESAGLLWLMNQAPEAYLAINSPSDDGRIVVRVIHYDTTITPVLKNGEMEIEVEIQGECFVLENNSSFDIAYRGDSGKVEQELSKKLKSQVEAAVRALQQKYRSDPAGFGQSIYRKYPEQWEHLKDKWRDTFPEQKVNIAVNIHLEHPGTIVAPSAKKQGGASSD